MRATRLARHLQAAGAGAGSLVGVCLARSHRHAGGAARRHEGGRGICAARSRRTHRIVSSSCSRTVALASWSPRRPLTSSSATSVRLGCCSMPITRPSPGARRNRRCRLPVSTASPTSSTPRARPESPRASRSSHRALVNFLASMRQQPGPGGRRRPAGGDDHLVRHRRPGAVPAAAGGRHGGRSRAVRRRPTAHACSTCCGSGATAHAGDAGDLADARSRRVGGKARSALKVLCGGEALPRDLAERLLARAGEVWNLYGPTETTIWSTLHRVVSEPGPVIDRPPHREHQHLRARRGGRAGPHRRRRASSTSAATASRVGYLNRPELTAERFVPTRSRRARARACTAPATARRYRADGVLEYLGPPGPSGEDARATASSWARSKRRWPRAPASGAGGRGPAGAPGGLRRVRGGSRA